MVLTVGPGNDQVIYRGFLVLAERWLMHQHPVEIEGDAPKENYRLCLFRE